MRTALFTQTGLEVFRHPGGAGKKPFLKARGAAYSLCFVRFAVHGSAHCGCQPFPGPVSGSTWRRLGTSPESSERKKWLPS